MDDSKLNWHKTRHFISKALARRLNEICKSRSGSLHPDRFGENSGYVEKFLEFLTPVGIADLGGDRTDDVNPGWMDWDGDCLGALSRISLNDSLPCHAAASPLPEPASQVYAELKKNNDNSFSILTERYPCPLNLLLQTETEICESLLQRLMVSYRPKLDRKALNLLDHDALLLQLNLVGVKAVWSGDLRYLDSMNYYYERLPFDWKPDGAHPWLLLSFWGIYMRALASWTRRI